MRMRVLHVFRSYYPDSDGGVERAIDHLIGGTAGHGVSNHVFALSPSPAARPFRWGRGVVHQRRRHLELASCSISLNTVSFFRRLAAKADVLHYHFPWPFADALHLLTATSRPALVTYHSDIVRQRMLKHAYAPVMRRFLARMDAVVATSPQYESSSPVLQTLPEERRRVIPLGLDEYRYPEADPARVAYWRERLGTGFFLFVGVLRYYKGLHVLVEAMRSVAGKAVVVGAGPMEASLQQQCTDAGVGSRVVFLSHLPDADKAALLSLCRAMVFPSHRRSEAFGVSLIEAAMFGRPMITADIGTGTSFVNKHGETGLVVPPENASALADAMRRLTDAPEEAERMGRCARDRFEQVLRIERSADAYVDLYETLLAERTRALTQS